jgi:gamma-glutamyltranspeptidase/glutathione hydrolase
MPQLGWDAVTVPGAVDAWVTLSAKFGRLPFGDLFEPAVHYAQDGFLVSPKTAAKWSLTPELYKDYPEFAAAFLPDGKAPHTGERFCFPEQADTLREIAETRGESFYRGKLAGRIADHARATGGAMTEADLSEHRSQWVGTIDLTYQGVNLHEIPPNGQGLTAMIALGILRHLNIRQYPVDSADSLHLQLEVMKIAFSEAYRHIADPAYMVVNVQTLLDDDFLAERVAEIDMEHAGLPRSRLPADKGTVYLTAADENGMMISMIQSNFNGFGSGIAIPGTGISMQNRGYGFTLEAGHPNQVGGGKRPYHTIIPGFVIRDQKPVMSLRRGHEIIPNPTENLFGGAQLICCLEGGYCAASDHRKDGQAVGF